MKLKFRADAKDVVIFIIFCIVLLYFIAIAVINIHSFAIEQVFKGLNPFPAFSGELILPTVVLYFLTLIALMMACSNYFFEREEGIGFSLGKKQKADGYSKLLSDKQMKKEYGIKKIHLKDDNYDAGGIPIINNGVDAWVDDSGQPHSLIMGASGSGKTQALMYPYIKILGRHGESMIVTDPKGELYEECGNMLKEKGYKIILINFRDPKEGSAWNPFSYPYRIYKEGNVDKANELLQDLASNILIDPNNKAEPFWEQTASNFFTGLSLGLFDDATEDEVNINSINMMAEVGEDKIPQSQSVYIKEYFKSKGELSPAYIAASSCINAPNETRGGIMSTFRTKTRIFSSQEGLSEMLSYSDFDMRDIGREKTAVFLKVHDEKTTYHALATIFVKQAYEALIAVAQDYPNLKLPYRTNFILDEFANMPALKDVGTMITASRSRNIRFSFAIQNFSQLTQVYGKEVAETIKGNCGNFVYIMSTELSALEEISKLLGDKKPEKAKQGEPAPPIRPLFTVSDLQKLKEGEVIINRFRSGAFKTKLQFNYKIDWGKKYDKMEYTQRPKHEVKVFDLKGYVSKLKGIQNPTGSMMGGTMMGMPNMNVMPFMGNTYVPGGMRPNPMMGINPDDFIKRLEEEVKILEEQEKKEKEEKEEKEKLENKVNEIIDNPTEPIIIDEDIDVIRNNDIEQTEEDIQKQIAELLENRKAVKQKQSDEEITPLVTENDTISNTSIDKPVEKEDNDITITPLKAEDDSVSNSDIDVQVTNNTSITPVISDNDIIDDSQVDVQETNDENDNYNVIIDNNINQNKEYTHDSITTKPTYEELEKPKINIDVDSVVVNNHDDKNDDFFDDFFGSEDE